MLAWDLSYPPGMGLAKTIWENERSGDIRQN